MLFLTLAAMGKDHVGESRKTSKPPFICISVLGGKQSNSASKKPNCLSLSPFKM